MRLLQIEDDPDVLEISKLAIQMSEGIELYQKTSGAAALDALSSVNPDVILLDVMMDDMSGPETLDRIRAAGHADVPVIFLTGRARDSDLESLSEHDIAGIITKPFDPLTLVDEIRRILSDTRGT